MARETLSPGNGGMSMNINMNATLVPPWLRYVLFGGALWLCVALVRGVTFALTHAAHGF
jgi:hypothetical protein